MDYPKSVPGVGLVNGKFVDEDPTIGRVGSIVPSAWGNMITDEAINLMALAGVAPDETKTNQLAQAVTILMDRISHGQCRLSVVTPTQIKLGPFNGNRLFVNGKGWKIPADGIPLTNAGLAASTVYYAYAAQAGANLALELSTTGRMTDPDTGYQVKKDDPSRSLVGMILTNAAAQFQDTFDFAGCANWFNRRNVCVSFNAATFSFSNTISAELSTGLRLTFLAWGDEAIHGSLTGTCANTVTGTNTVATLVLNGANWAGVSGISLPGVAPSGAPIASAAGGKPIEGKNVTTVYGYVTAGVGSILGNTNGSVTARI